MHELIDNLREALDEEKNEILTDGDYDSDRIHEIVDGLVPIYYSELAQLLAQDTSLGFVDEVDLVADKSNVWDMLSVSVYCRLHAAAYAWLSEVQEAV
jgi:hypothetical protein